ncbi:MAG: COX15/CtaA family protein, partial [Acidimicrobiales bacterium]
MDRSPITAARYQRLTLITLVTLVVIVVTGGAVRLTGSGLGCPDWPTCTESNAVPPLEFHALVEFVNRLVTFVVAAATVYSLRWARRRQPRRDDLVRWSGALVAGVAAQGILGGLTVKLKLVPPIVMAHFLLSMVLLW